MAITLKELLNRVKEQDGLFVLLSTEAVLYDRNSATVYIPRSNYRSTSLNLLGDFKSHIGHNLLWSRHEDVDALAGEMLAALQNAGFRGELRQADHKGSIYELVPDKEYRAA